MPSATFPRFNSGGFLAHLASPFGFLGVGAPNVINADSSTAQGVFAPGIGQHTVYNFGNVGPTGPPATALITDAYLQLLSGNFFGADQTGAFDCVAALVDRDGLWDNTSAFIFGPGAPLADVRLNVLNTGAASISGGFTHANTPTTSFGANQNSIGAGITRGGQTVLITTAGNLGSAVIRLGRSSASFQTFSMDVYQAGANDGSDDTPSGSVLATSNTVAHNTLSTGSTGGDVTFTFSGGNQIALSSGTRYVFVVRPSSTIPYNIYADTTAPYANGSAQLAGIRVGFSASNYPQSGDLPWLFNAGTDTINVPPFGGLVTDPFEFPPFPAPYGSFITVRPPELRQLIQAWIQDGSYATNREIAIQLHSLSAEPAATRVWTNANLIVHWRVARNIYVG